MKKVFRVINALVVCLFVVFALSLIKDNRLPEKIEGYISPIVSYLNSQADSLSQLLENSGPSVSHDAVKIAPDSASGQQHGKAGNTASLAEENGRKIEYISENYMANTGIGGLSVYEYGKSLLSAREQDCYNQIAEALLNMRGSVVIDNGPEPAAMKKVVRYCLNDHVEFFYYDHSTMQTETLTMDRVKSYRYTLEFYYSYDAVTVAEYRKQIAESGAKLLAAAAGLSGDAQKHRALHDTLIRNCRYDTDAASGDPAMYNDSFNIYGSMVKGKAVCEGYAEAMKLLLDTAGVKTLVVSGTVISSEGQEEHAWNIVNIGGKWYETDATFDDPVVYGFDSRPTGREMLSHDYLLFTPETEPKATTRRIGAFNAVDPFGNSENYEVLPPLR